MSHRLALQTVCFWAQTPANEESRVKLGSVSFRKGEIRELRGLRKGCREGSGNCSLQGTSLILLPPIQFRVAGMGVLVDNQPQCNS